MLIHFYFFSKLGTLINNKNWKRSMSDNEGSSTSGSETEGTPMDSEKGMEDASLPLDNKATGDVEEMVSSNIIDQAPDALSFQSSHSTTPFDKSGPTVIPGLNFFKTFVEHPVLKSNDLHAIRKWAKEYDRYLLEVSNNPGQIPKDRISCMETDILMEIAELDLDKDMSELREVDVQRWVENKVTFYSKKSIDQLQEIMREWKMDLNVDWHDRVSRYYKTYLDSMLKHDLLMSFESEELRKKKIQGLLRGVRPAKLRDVMRTKHALLQQNKEQTSVSVFFNLLKKTKSKGKRIFKHVG